MNWSNVKLILHREVRDQLRDRRTLFMIAVLPLLLYPLLGMSMFQVMQFVSEHPTHVLIIGAEELPDSPRLVDGHHFDRAWFTSADRAGLLEVSLPGDEPAPGASSEKAASMTLDDARGAVERGEYEAVVYFPPDFGERLGQFRASLGQRLETDAGKSPEPSVPSPEIYYNTAKEKSQI